MRSSLILPHIDRLPPYVTGVQPSAGGRSIKLNQNESPYPPSPQIREVLAAAAVNSLLERYPDPTCTELRSELSLLWKQPKERFFAGNGSSEIISLIMKVFVGEGGKVALPYPSFFLYESAAAGFQADCRLIPTRADMSIDVQALIDSGAKAVILVNPNAPTGLLLELDQVERLVREFPGLVVVDEAYMDYAEGRESAIPLVGGEELTNLIVLRTFSKSYGLCGARVGYACAGEVLIGALEKGKDIYNVNSLSQRLAAAVLRDQDYMEEKARAVRRTRESFVGKLLQLGFQVLPSEANFVLCSPPASAGIPASKLYKRLQERGIHVRYFERPRLEDKLRISIGTDEQMDTLVMELKELLHSSSYQGLR
jgi:histidinol-phosphate aminotransferase